MDKGTVMIKFSIDIQPGFEKLMVRAALERIGQSLRRNADAIRDEVRDYMRIRIIKSDTWKSLFSGKLRGELGLNKRHERLTAILKAWEDCVRVYSQPQIVGNELKNALIIKVLESYNTAAQLPQAIINSKGGDVPWLLWLLTAGTSVVVGNYHVKTGLTASEKHRSRTGEAIMVPGKVYRVPAEFSGTQSNNFVTRALSDAPAEVTRIITKWL